MTTSRRSSGHQAAPRAASPGTAGSPGSRHAWSRREYAALPRVLVAAGVALLVPFSGCCRPR